MTASFTVCSTSEDLTRTVSDPEFGPIRIVADPSARSLLKTLWPMSDGLRKSRGSSMDTSAHDSQSRAPSSVMVPHLRQAKQYLLSKSSCDKGSTHIIIASGHLLRSDLAM